MKNVYLAIIVAAVFGNNAFAMTLSGVTDKAVSNTAKARLQSEPTPIQPAPKPSNPQCPKYAGVWVGKCTEGQNSYEDKIKIEQNDCNDLKINDEVVPLYGLDARTLSMPVEGMGYVTSTIMSTAYWDLAQPGLIIDSHISVNMEDGKQIFNDTIHGQLRPSSDSGLVATFIGMATQVSCTYSLYQNFP